MLVSVNIATGVGTNVGSTGIGGMMDLAFDSSGVLWATTGGNVWTINTATGASTFKGSVTGVVNSANIMGIAFDASDNLYATVYESNSRLLQLNTTTLNGTVIGSTGLFFAHGGDILVSAQAVPEPGTLAMFGLGGIGLAFGALRRRFSKEV
jgi:hypothetical protein